VLTWGDYGKLTLPQLLGLNHWPVIGAVIVLIVLLFWQLEKYEAAQPTIILHKKTPRPR
jgi:uncharacterized protein